MFKANEQQRKAIEFPSGPLMILAGAGTGKTYTLENKIIHLIQHYHINPQNILAITYTEKAAKELKERIIGKAGNSAQELTVSTFHAFCFQLLKEFSPATIPQLLEESEVIHLLLKNFDALGPYLSEEFPTNPQKAVLESFIPFFNRSRDELIEPHLQEISDQADSYSTEIINQIMDLKRIYPLFQQWKRDMNVVDYGDMIFLAYQLLKNNLAIRKQVQNRYHYVIIDEFQDNNYALNEIAGFIVEHSKNITVVGDENQTIYSFRGANEYNISDFKKRYQCTVLPLEENFRSYQEILDIANATIQNNHQHQLQIRLQSYKGSSGLKPSLFWGSREEQLEFLCSEVFSLINQHTHINDIAVLTRTHGQAEEVRKVLQQSSITVQAPIPGFFDIKAVKDLISWCQVIGEGKYQDNALYRLIQSKCGAKTAFSVYKVLDRKVKSTRFKLIQNERSLFNQHANLKNLIDLILELKNNARKLPAGEMLWEICEKTKLMRPYEKQYSLDDRLALMNLGDLLQRAHDFSKRNPQAQDLKEFNVYLEAVMMSRKLQTLVPDEFENLNGIKVATIHSVKGGEFPIVFVPFLQSGSFPLNFKQLAMIQRPPEFWSTHQPALNRSPKEHFIEEERRLFYVAVTRAKEKLYLLAPTSRTSIFIKEISKSLFEVKHMNKTENKQSISELRLKYEQKILKAIAADQFDAAKNYVQAIEIIHQHERGETIQLGQKPWEQELKTELSGEFDPDVNGKLYLSASSIETYQQCPLQYRFGKIDHIPQSASKPASIFGNIIHAVLQRLHEPGSELTETNILHLLDEEWKKGEFEYEVREEKFYEQGQEILKRYIQFILQNPPNVLRREERFSFELNDFAISGAIDRIDKVETGVRVVDYKTSKTFTSAKSNIQLAIYSLYLEQSDSKEYSGIPASAALHFLRDPDDPFRSHTFSINELEETKHNITEIAGKIRNKIFPAIKGFHCDWCDYKNLLCPAWEEK